MKNNKSNQKTLWGIPGIFTGVGVWGLDPVMTRSGMVHCLGYAFNGCAREALELFKSSSTGDIEESCHTDQEV
eukprot:2402834-Amphidinium_carterae.1